jgi:hypothetical protein
MSDRRKKQRIETVQEERPHFINDKLTPTVFEVDPEAPMILVPFDSFVSFGSIPRSSDRASLNVTYYDELVNTGVRSECLVAFISHRWLNPTMNAKDMHPDRGNAKYRTLVDGFSRLLSGLHIARGNVFLWIDFCCIEQDKIDVLAAGVRR